MKNMLLVFCFGLSSLGTAAQEVAVELPKNNVIYAGIDNEVNIVVKNYPQHRIVFETHGCTIVTKDKKTYLQAEQRGTCILETSVSKRGKAKWISTHEFRVRAYPIPELRFGTLDNGYYSYATLKAQSFLSFFGGYLPHEGPKAKIVTYSMLILAESGFFLGDYTSQKFTIPQLRQIQNLERGGYLSVFNICADYLKDTVTVPSLKIGIKPTQKMENDLSLYGYLKCGDSIFKFSSENVEKKLWNGPVRKIGSWVAEKHVCGIRHLLYAKEYRDDTLISEKHFYPDSSLRWQYKQVDSSVFYYTESGYLQMKGKVITLNDSIHYQSTPFDSTFDLRWLNYLPIGEWQMFYPDGKLKSSGSYKLQVINKTEEMVLTNDPYDLTPIAITEYTSVKSGTWYSYNPKGSVIYSMKYD